MDVKLQKFIKKCEEKYSIFINQPFNVNYDIKSKVITLDKSKKMGFDSWATAHYDIISDKHFLEIWENIHELSSDYILFHEFTHMLDAHTYTRGNKVKYVQNHGYTEFHASQVETLLLLGAKKVSDEILFTMNTEIETISEKMTIEEFVYKPYNLACDMISREDFPANIEALKITLGLIFNYYGRRSICKKYAMDFDDNIDTTVITSLIFDDTVKALNIFLTDFLTDDKITVLDDLYGRMIMGLISKYNLKD